MIYCQRKSLRRRDNNSAHALFHSKPWMHDDFIGSEVVRGTKVPSQSFPSSSSVAPGKSKGSLMISHAVVLLLLCRFR